MIEPRRFNMANMGSGWVMERAVDGKYVPYLDFKVATDELQRSRDKYKNLYLALSQFVPTEMLTQFYMKGNHGSQTITPIDG